MGTCYLLCLGLMIASQAAIFGKAAFGPDAAGDPADSFLAGDPARLGVDIAALGGSLRRPRRRNPTRWVK